MYRYTSTSTYIYIYIYIFIYRYIYIYIHIYISRAQVRLGRFERRVMPAPEVEEGEEPEEPPLVIASTPYFTEMCSGSEAGSYLSLIDCG